MPDRRSSCQILPPAAAATVLFCAISLLLLQANTLHAQSARSTTWAVTIVLPPKVVAGQPATLAVFDVNGRLAPGVTVDVGNGQRVTTDQTGRAVFTAPASGGVMLAKASATIFAALVDPAAPADAAQGITVASAVSLKDRFSICGAGFRSDADSNRVKMNGEPALVLAASPECLVVLPSPRSIPGAAKISVETPDSQWSAATTLVSLHFEDPQPPLTPDKKSRLVVHVEGSDQALGIVVENQTPGVLRFLHGDSQELRTSGGAQNTGTVDIETIRSGDFSFHARLVPAPDLAAAARYLQAAEALAPKNLQRRLKDFVDKLAKHPSDSGKVRHELEQIISATITGDFRTLLESADAAL